MVNLVKNYSVSYLFYSFVVGFFNLSHFIKLNKLCVNDTLLILHTLSSNVLTLWFFLLVCVLLIFWAAKNINFFLWFICITLWFYFLTSNLKYTFVSTVFSTQSINTTLQNGLLNIHPVMIYSTYASILLYWLLNYFYFKVNSILLNSTTNVFTFLSVAIVGVYLGAFWACQELNWGGFWSWDPVEMVSLFLFLWFLVYFHKRTNKIISKPVNHVIILITLIYLIIRLGIVNTIHSFIRSNSTPYIVYIATVFIILVSIKNLIKYYYLFKYKFFKWFLVVLSLTSLYLYLYVFMLINQIDSSLINPIVLYFTIILASLYLLIVRSLKNKNKFYFVYAYIFNTLLLLYIQQNTLTMCILFLITCTLLTFKKINVHATFIYSYIIFFIFFTNLPIYNSSAFSNYSNNFCVGSINNCLNSLNYYESFFF